MGRHVIGALAAVVDPGLGRVVRRRHQQGKKRIQIAAYIRIGIFLDHQRTGAVPDEYCQKPRPIPLIFDEFFDIAGEFIEARSPGLYGDVPLHLNFRPNY